MNVHIEGQFYDDIILQCMYPEVADVSAEDYVAKSFSGKKKEEKQRPFIVCAKEEVTLKVETWLGTVITWTFPVGPYPMPLKRIIHDAGNSKTSIQISY